KGMRQPQENSCSSGKAATGMKTKEERTIPNMTPEAVNDDRKPRRRVGACSMASDAAPGDSPPADSPCNRRKMTSKIGAKSPIWPYVGSKPIAKVARPMVNK